MSYYLLPLLLVLTAAGESRAEHIRKFSEYRSNYIMVYRTDRELDPDTNRRGRQGNIVKFQYSSKLNVAQFGQGKIRCTTYFGYTQKSFWDVFDQFLESQSFTEHNFNPEIFHTVTGLLPIEVSASFFEHESTGTSGAASKGWNRAYVQL